MNNVNFNEQLSLILNTIKADTEYNISLIKRLIKSYTIPDVIEAQQDFEYELHLYKLDIVSFMQSLNEATISNIIIRNNSGYDFNVLVDIFRYVFKICLTYALFRFGTDNDENTYIKISDIVFNNIVAVMKTIDVEVEIVALDDVFHNLIKNEIDKLLSTFKVRDVNRIIGAEALENIQMFFRNKGFMYDILADNILTILIVK